jgi:rSAM/selenodomain-associated transferase 1
VSQALLVVVKQPIPGQVKTRLADVLDPKQTARFYECLILDTLELMTRVSSADKGILYTPDTSRSYFERVAGLGDFIFAPQRGPDLGTRLLNAFRDFLDMGYERVAILDSDSPTLPAQYLERAFALLEENDVVFGPCEDGGYYLVGARQAYPALFLGIEMSTPTVLEETLKRASELDLKVGMLQSWFDVDFPGDLARLRRDLLDEPQRALQVARFFDDLAADAQSKWNRGATRYADYAETRTGRMRFILTGETLERHLPDTQINILEVGFGIGELAVRLAKQGHRVVGCDSSPEMVRMASERATRLSPQNRARLDLRKLDLVEAAHVFMPGSFQCLVLHTVLDYLEEPLASLEALLPLLSPGGILSVVRINHVSDVLRAALDQQDPKAALQLMGNRSTYSNLFDLTARATTLIDAVTDLESLDLHVVGTYGLRIFADYLPTALLNDSSRWEEVLHLERACCDVAPYNAFGRYVHVVAKKS